MEPIEPEPAVLVISVLAARKEHLSVVMGPLVEKFGPLSMVSSWMPFSDTPYYEDEMGGTVARRALVFSKPVGQASLSHVKAWTNALEGQHSLQGQRLVNLDPGFLLPGRFVLATAKDFTHRICIGGGFYADLTLIYKDGGYKALPWTYSDYAKGPMHDFLTDVRRRFMSGPVRT